MELGIFKTVTVSLLAFLFAVLVASYMAVFLVGQEMKRRFNSLSDDINSRRNDTGYQDLFKMIQDVERIIKWKGGILDLLGVRFDGFEVKEVSTVFLKKKKKKKK